MFSDHLKSIIWDLIFDGGVLIRIEEEKIDVVDGMVFGTGFFQPKRDLLSLFDYSFVKFERGYEYLFVVYFLIDEIESVFELIWPRDSFIFMCDVVIKKILSLFLK